MESISHTFSLIHSSPHLREVIVFLLSAVLVVPVFRRLKTSPVLGYLLVGAVIGPFGLKAISDVEGARLLGEFGVIFLLFTIGLDLSLERLGGMSRLIFGLGGAQVICTGLIIGGIAWAWGNPLQVAIILGACLALSSTAIITQLLLENDEFSSPYGRTVFAVLLFQDLAVVPLLVMVKSLSSGVEPLSLDLLYALVKSILVVLVIIVVGRLTLRPLFRMVAGARSPELLMAMTLLAILATAIGTELVGLSMALGAFLAGMLLAETEFRHQVETDIQPFKGLLLGLFFIGVGMSIDLGSVLDRVVLIGASVIGLILIKAAIFFCLGYLFRLPGSVSLRGALLLGPGGEFALLIIGAALAANVLDPDVGQFMMIVAALSMAVTPLMMPFGQWLAGKWRKHGEKAYVLFPAAASPDLSNHVIIAGFGRVGQTIAAILTSQKIPYVALDLNPPATSQYRKKDMPIYYGDVERTEMLEQVGIARAAALVLTIDTPQTAKRALASIRARWPDIPVFVRAHDSTHIRQLEILGATGVVPETLEASLALAGQVLNGIGIPMDAVNNLIGRIREEHYSEIETIGRPPDDGMLKKTGGG
ncbi:MAG: monovalent cation:proton antiporter-2 (CPA2) family protein [Pseudomonadota bacterium]